MPRFVGGGVLHEIDAQATAEGGLCMNEKGPTSAVPRTPGRPKGGSNLAFIWPKWPASA